jgi:hypothetical protein
MPFQDPEKLRAYSREYGRQYRRENKDRLLKYAQEHYQKNRESRLEWQKKYREDNPEAVKASSVAYYAANKDKILTNVKAYRQRNRDRYLQYQTQYNQKKRGEINRNYKERNPIRYLLSRAKSRVRKTGIEFNLVENDLQMPARCPYFGTPLSFLGPLANRPSLDRINNKIGYVLGNVEIISLKANRLKRDMTLDEMISLGRHAAKLKAQS